MRQMIDSTHTGLATALPVIERELVAGDVVALYDTGSPNIAATPIDIASIPGNLHTIFIDQGFTGSPNMNATVRDCENGAWSLTRAVNRGGWNVKRPTLYLGFPDTVQLAFNMGWRGDAWLVAPAHSAPTTKPTVPVGINVVAVQWDFSDPNFDKSVVFDPTWPGGIVDPNPVVTPIVQQDWRHCTKCQGLFYGPLQAASHCPTGGQHESTGSGNYVLLDITGAGQ